MIPLYKRHQDDQEQVAVETLIDKGELSQGSYIEQLEEEFARYVGSPYAVAVNSCTNAMRICMDYLDEGNDQYFVPAMTFVSVANEVGSHTLGDFTLVDEIYVGDIYDIDGKIYDCAHRVDRGMYKNGYMCFSLYPGKSISGAEGGLIATENKNFVQWAKSYRQCGRTAYGASYDVVNRGIKANMTNLQACIGLHALRKLDENKEKLKKVRERYNEALSLNNTSDYCYRVNVFNRDEFRKHMDKNNITTSIHFKPIYYFEAYKDIWNPEDFPNTEKEWQTTVSIPFYPDLTEKDQDKVINLTKQWLTS